MPQKLRLTGYLSAIDVAAVFASPLLSSIARMDEIAVDGMAVSSTDPNWPKDQKDFDWLCLAIQDALALDGVLDVKIAPLVS
jgi:hypothetical protein